MMLASTCIILLTTTAFCFTFLRPPRGLMRQQGDLLRAPSTQILEQYCRHRLFGNGDAMALHHSSQ